MGEHASLDLHMTQGQKRLIRHAASLEKGVMSEVLWEGEEDSSVISWGPVPDFNCDCRGAGSVYDAGAGSGCAADYGRDLCVGGFRRGCRHWGPQIDTDGEADGAPKLSNRVDCGSVPAEGGEQ